MTDVEALAIVALNFPFGGEDTRVFRKAVAQIALTDYQSLYSLIHRIKGECRNEAGVDLRSVIAYRNTLSLEEKRALSVKQTREQLAQDYINKKNED